MPVIPGTIVETVFIEDVMFVGVDRGGGPLADELWRISSTGVATKINIGSLVNLQAFATVGPNNITNLGEWLIFGEEFLNEQQNVFGLFDGALYDATNGSVSAGDIVRVGP